MLVSPLCENDLIPEAARLMAAAKANGGNIPVPTDVVTGKAFSEEAMWRTLKQVADISTDDMIFDIGPDSTAELVKILENCRYYSVEWPCWCV